MDSKYEKNKFARTHEEARMCVCCCCGRKVKIQKGKTLIKVVDEKTEGLVVKFVFSDFLLATQAIQHQFVPLVGLLYRLWKR